MPTLSCSVPGCDRQQYARGLCGRDYQLHRAYPAESPEQLGLRRRRFATPEEVMAKIKARVNVTDTGCWEWTGASLPQGYGSMRWNGKHWRVHRLAFHLFVEETDPAIAICHRCDNPPCCNPNHLFAGTHWENMWDMQTKGRAAVPGAMRGETNPRATLTADDVRAIRSSTARQVDLAKQYGVGQPAISAIRLRKTWKHVV